MRGKIRHMLPHTTRINVSKTPKYFCGFFLLLLVTLSHGAVLQFQADLTPDAVVPGDPLDDPSASTASGTAYFTLTTGGANGPELSYTVDLSGLYYDTELPRASSTGPDNLVRAVHIHFGAIGTNGWHALNIYGVPREDDGDLVVQLNSLSGNWDDSDENFNGGSEAGMGDSVALTDALTELQNGELYVQVHTFGYRAGEIRGQITSVPEPSSLSLMIPLLGISMFSRHRKQL